jgi:2-isopropylmalate synthase
MERVLVFDTTLRDGEQAPGSSMTPAEKLRMARQLETLGVDVIEAGFAASSPADFESVREIAREVRRPVIATLARAADRDIDQAGAALEPAERSRIHVFLATSDIHLRHKLRITPEECLERTAIAVERARRYTDDVEFSAEDATRSDLEFLCRVVEVAVRAGARTINLPDTVGYAHPDEIRNMLATVMATVPGVRDVVLSVHCHNDLGLAVANSLAGIAAGARQVECTINGIGERAGNAALEEIVMALRTRRDHFPYDTGVDTTEIYRSSYLLTHITGIHPQPNKAIVGKNAFAHEAGIHQDGVLKERTTYEIMTPESVGLLASNLVLGKHSGRHALAQRYKALGYELDDESLKRCYDLFKRLADEKKNILDEDLLAILHHGTMEDAPQRYRLRKLQVTCGEAEAEAHVGLEIEGTLHESSAEGDGPLAAAFAAVNAMAYEHTIELHELSIEAITPGGDAVGEASLRATIDGKTFTGTAAAPDIVNAAVRAYLVALNKAAHARSLEAVALQQASDVWGV